MIKKYIIYKHEYDNVKKLPKLDFYPNPDLCSLEIQGVRKYLVMPKMPGNNLAEIINDQMYIENNLIHYRKLSKDKTSKMLDAYSKLTDNIELLHSYGFTHNDLNLRNIIYDEEKNMMYIIDFETLKENDNVELDFKQLIFMLDELKIIFNI